MDSGLPRDKRTPASEVQAIIDMAFDVYSRYLKILYGNSDEELSISFEKFVRENKKIGPDGDKEVDEFYDYLNLNPNQNQDGLNKGVVAFFKAMSIVVSYSRQALHAKDLNLAWGYVVSAMFWVGKIQAFDFGFLACERSASRMSRSGAKAKDEIYGHRDKREKIRDLWAEGNFLDRDRCAEQESAALEMSFSTARKALRNTPDPDPWPAKEKTSKTSRC